MEELAAPETLTDMDAPMIARRGWLAQLPLDTMTGFQATEVLEFGAKLESESGGADRGRDLASTAL
jgi:hypothetical protein